MIKILKKNTSSCDLLKITYDYDEDVLEIEEETVVFSMGERTKYLPCVITPNTDCDMYDPIEIEEVEKKLTFYYCPESHGDVIQEGKNYWYGLGLTDIDVLDIVDVPLDELTLILRR